MGNTNSTTNNPAQQGPRPGDKHSPSPLKTTDPSLRQKKKSLELPDLTPGQTYSSPSRGRTSQQTVGSRPTAINANPTKSANIPIPRGPEYNVLNIPGEAGRIRAPITLPSEVDVTTLQHDEYSTHRPFPPNREHRDRDKDRDRDSRGRNEHGSRRHKDKDRERNREREREEQYRNEQRIQEIYYHSQSHAAQATPRQSTFVPQIVHSSIPIVLGKHTEDSEGLLPPSDSDVLMMEPRDVKIIWRGGGKSVFLARAGDDDWKGRLEMIPESPGSTTYHATVSLAPGTHHIRFLIDDQWRVADDYPTAVDDQGSLANYVAVSIQYSSAPAAGTAPNPSTSPVTSVRPSPPQIQLPQTPRQNPPLRRLQPGQSFWSAASSNDDGTDDTDPHAHSPQRERQTAQQRAAAAAAAIQKENWTSVIPAELVEAARLEEEYLEATSNPQGYDGYGSGYTHSHSSSGRIQTHTSGFIPVPQIPQPPALPRHLDKLILNTRGLTAGPGHQNSSTSLGSAAGRGDPPSGSGRNRHERSSSIGTGQGSSGREKKSGRDREGREEGRERERGGRERRGRDRERQWPAAPPPSEADTSIEVTSPEGETKPANGVVTGSESQESNASGSSTNTAGTATTVTPETSAPPTPVIPASSSTSPPQPAPPTSRPLTVTLDQPTTIVGGKTITNVPNPTLTDDASVLPVPSHAVLQHLSTSSIRNGVLAVATTSRYRKKYLTSIYYKPT